MTDEAVKDNRQNDLVAILFVDDEKNILSSLKRLFRPVGYRIFTATSGAEGLSILQNERVDMVISDMRMPEMDGAAFLAQVAEQWPDVVRILLTGYADVTSTVSAINKGGIYKYISKPWEDNDIKLSVEHALEKKYLEGEKKRLEQLTKRQNEELKEINANLEDRVQARTKDLAKVVVELKSTHESLKNSYTASVKVFSNLVEMRDKNAAGHSRRVAEQAHKLALEMDMDRAGAQNVVFAALLHDIGKIGLSDEILNKPFNSLDPKERLEVIKHPIKGQAVLMSLDPLQEAAKIIRCHHEQYNGQGYPEGLMGEEIPLGARILSVVNDFDALLIGTLWTQKYSQNEALEYIGKHRGSYYDPKVVEKFILGYKPVVEDKWDKESIKELKSNSLLEGMVLARDLFTPEEVLMLAKDHVLDERLILRIQNIERSLDFDFTIYVYTGNDRGAPSKIISSA